MNNRFTNPMSPLLVLAAVFVHSIQVNSFPTFKQFHAPIPKPTASKITRKHGGNSDHLAKIPSEFISCLH